MKIGDRVYHAWNDRDRGTVTGFDRRWTWVRWDGSRYSVWIRPDLLRPITKEKAA